MPNRQEILTMTLCNASLGQPMRRMKHMYLALHILIEPVSPLPKYMLFYHSILGWKELSGGKRQDPAPNTRLELQTPTA